MIMKKGKRILKSKTPKFCGAYIFLIFGGSLIIPYLILKTLELLNQPHRFTFSFLDFSMMFLGILCLLPGMMIFISYIIIYEKHSILNEIFHLKLNILNVIILL